MEKIRIVTSEGSLNLNMAIGIEHVALKAAPTGPILHLGGAGG